MTKRKIGANVEILVTLIVIKVLNNLIGNVDDNRYVLDRYLLA